MLAQLAQMFGQPGQRLSLYMPSLPTCPHAQRPGGEASWASGMVWFLEQLADLGMVWYGLWNSWRTLPYPV